MEFVFLLIGGLVGFIIGGVAGGGALAAFFGLKHTITPTGSSGTVPIAEVATESVLQDLRAAAGQEAVDQLVRPAAVHPDQLAPEIPADLIRQVQSASTVEQARELTRRYVQDHDAADVITLIAQWRPRRRQRGVDLTESEYEESLVRHLERYGVAEQIVWKPRVMWAGDRELGGAARRAVPDLAFRNRVLVELKADILRSDQADRSLGQMLRYLLAWKPFGPAVLVVCGEAAPELRSLVKLYVNMWRRTLGLPVTVFFRRADDSAQADFREGPSELDGPNHGG